MALTTVSSIGPANALRAFTASGHVSGFVGACVRDIDATLIGVCLCAVHSISCSVSSYFRRFLSIIIPLVAFVLVGRVRQVIRPYSRGFLDKLKRRQVRVGNSI